VVGDEDFNGEFFSFFFESSGSMIAIFHQRIYFLKSLFLLASGN